MTSRLFNRAADPGVTTEMAMAAAEAAKVCVRPLLRRVTDRATGNVYTVPLACGATQETVCPPCAEKARRLRMHQCREGWHLTEDPPRHTTNDDGPAGVTDDQDGDLLDGPDDEDNGAGLVDGESGSESRRARSTRRIDGFPDLPTVPV